MMTESNVVPRIIGPAGGEGYEGWYLVEEGDDAPHLYPGDHPLVLHLLTPELSEGSYFDHVVEWDEATGIGDDTPISIRIKVMTEEWHELTEALVKSDRVATADGMADLVWTVLGLAHGMGIPFDAVWEEVRRTNMAKVLPDGGVIRRGDGKIMKPPGWTPPDIEGVLRRHGSDS